MKIQLFTIPNLMTLGNLLLGCLGIQWVLDGQVLWASAAIGMALVLDFGDGFVARLLKQSSPLGQQLDSLADAVTFGVLPSFLMKYYLEQAGLTSPFSYVSFSIALFSVLRLAKFNIDTRQGDQFIGLPTPANAVVIASLPWMVQNSSTFVSFFYGLPFLISYVVIISYLLIAEIPLMAFKFKHFNWKGNEIRFSFLVLSAVFVLGAQWLAVPGIVLGYVVVSLVESWKKS
ncbi:MAG: CDP-diacylglycerol--serine O-phosphatidyltransferase [Spirosomataceae bacterium]